MYERQKQLMQERQANQDKWLNGYLRALEMDRNAANQDRNWQHQLQREALTDQRYENEWNRNESRYQQQQAEAKAAREQTQKNWQAAHDESVRHNKANEANSYIRAIKPTGGSGENSYKLGDYTVTVPANKLKNYKTFLNSIGESYGISWKKGKDKNKSLYEFEQEVMANPDARQYIIDWAKSNGGEVKENKKLVSTQQASGLGWGVKQQDEQTDGQSDW
jgi:alpha-D-ribose 1-methylphosphonate 5-triphosphate synthase subunit PhnG